ncbi:hypothetical protein CsatA_007889 [Cannabis sativa]
MRLQILKLSQIVYSTMMSFESPIQLPTSDFEYSTTTTRTWRSKSKTPRPFQTICSSLQNGGENQNPLPPDRAKCGGGVEEVILVERYGNGTAKSTVTLRLGEKKHYNNKVDVYMTFGIVLWELLTNRMSFEGISNLQAAYAAAFK